MSPAPVSTPRRFQTEAARALIGLWLIIVSLEGALPLYRWLAHDYPNHPAFSLASAIALAVVACVGLGLVAVAAFRGLMALIAPPVTVSPRL